MSGMRQLVVVFSVLFVVTAFSVMGRAQQAGPCSASCRTEGRCTLAEAACIATDEADCAASEGCVEHGRCVLFEGQCLSAAAPSLVGDHDGPIQVVDDDEEEVDLDDDELGDDDEGETDDGVFDDAHPSKPKRSVSEAVTDPWGPEYWRPDRECDDDDCYEYGECTLWDGECVAASSLDCNQAEACREGDRCYFDAKKRACLSNTVRTNTAALVLGIIGVSTGGGAALIGGVFLGLTASLCGGGCEEATAGFAALTGGGAVLLILGIVGISAGREKVPRGEKDGAVLLPTLVARPEGLGLEWSF